jgi:hypothetical protein
MFIFGPFLTLFFLIVPIAIYAIGERRKWREPTIDDLRAEYQSFLDGLLLSRDERNSEQVRKVLERNYKVGFLITGTLAIGFLVLFIALWLSVEPGLPLGEKIFRLGGTLLVFAVCLLADIPRLHAKALLRNLDKVIDDSKDLSSGRRS